MYICICKGITEKQLADEFSRSEGSHQEVLKRLGVGDSCGICLIDALNQLTGQKESNSQKTCSNSK